MNGSWHLGKLVGIDVRIHWTFLLLPIWIYFSSLAGGSGMAAATASVVFVLAIFGCVVLHELGHALTARKFGIPTRDITLLPIGGVASLQRIPRNPLQELAIAIAGPAVNVVIAALIFVSLALISTPMNMTGTGWVLFAKQLAWVNIALVVFNMIPAFPMDGGRVLRALMALALPYERATDIAAGVGQAVAIGLGLIGLFGGNLILVFVAGFVFLAARGEAFAVRQSNFGQPTHVPFEIRERVRESQPFWIGEDESQTQSQPIISADWSVESAFRWLAHKTNAEFPVIKNDHVIGFVRKEDLQMAIVSGKGQWPIERLLPVRFTPPGGLPWSDQHREAQFNIQ